MSVALISLQDGNYGGFNTYLTQRHFHMMIAVAAAIHVLALAIYAIMPPQDVLDIPVRILNVKLAGPSLASVNSTSKTKQEQHIQSVPSKDNAVKSKAAVPTPPQSASKDSAVAYKSKASKVVAAKESSRRKQARKSRSEQAVDAVSASFRAKTLPATNTRGRSPSHFVRAQEGAFGEGSIYGNNNLSETEVVRRYEQILSLWIEQHKVYPVEARRHKQQGNALVRIRIDRNGNILRFRLEQATGHALIDNAIGQMIAAANPVPAVPENYPAGREIEFLVPVSFRVLE